MVKLIIGGTGTGKTKTLIEQVNAAVQEEKGSVVCISRGSKLTFDISYGARLINIVEYPVKDYESLLGFLCGLHAGNYDISRVFIDGLYKIAGAKEPSRAEAFLEALDKVSTQHHVDFTISLSEDAATVTEGMKRFL